MGKFKGSTNGQEVEISINWKLNPTEENPNAVQIKNFKIDDIQLIPLSTQTFPMLKNIEGAPGSMDRKKELWVPRGDSEDAARCFMESINDEMPCGWWNIGLSKIEVTYENSTFTPYECAGYRGAMEMGAFIKTIYASTCYYDLVHKENPDCFSPYIIHTTKDPEMSEALIADGWVRPDAGDSFFDAFTSIEPEVLDGRPARFANEDGHFVERCIVTDDSAQGWHYGYEAKDLLVYPIETHLAGLTPFEDDSGAAAGG